MLLGAIYRDNVVCDRIFPIKELYESCGEGGGGMTHTSCNLKWNVINLIKEKYNSTLSTTDIPPHAIPNLSMGTTIPSAS